MQTESLVSRIMTTVLCSIIVMLVLYVVQELAPYFEESGRLGQGGLTSHETTISASVVKPESIDTQLSDIGGLDDIKDDLLVHVILPLKRHEIFFASKSRALMPSRGVLLVGKPGTGKTMMARAIAKECGVQFLSLTLATLENKYFGESSKLLAAAFSLARKLQPCILFFDEIDGMLRERSTEDQGCNYSFKTEFLTHMDGIRSQSSDAVIVIGCTNNARVLDPALRRRLPKVYEIRPPSGPDRMKILQMACRNEGCIEQTTVPPWLEAATEGMTGSDLQDLYTFASSERLRSMRDRIEMATSAESLQLNMPAVAEEHWRAALTDILAKRTQEDHCLEKSARSRLEGLLERMERVNAAKAEPSEPAAEPRAPTASHPPDVLHADLAEPTDDEEAPPQI